MIKLDAIINDKKLLDSIQKGVNQFNRSRAGKSKLNLKINEKGFRQPLGRITGDLDKFESALAASNARVIAFGASTAVIGGITKAFKALAVTTTTVQKHFADINRILNVSAGQFEKFSNELFNIGKKTATSFEDSSKAALEFARQGLGLNETLKRTADALTLVRLTGVNADKAVSALTATVNAFKTQSISTSDALNKFVAVETKFAVSARDLMDALGRVGSAAVDAKVDFNELNAMVAAVQQQTGRGGAVIGNALKTIFTRIQRKDTLKALEDYGIAVRDIEGSTLPAMNILKQFASTYKTLTDSNKAYLREQVAGVFQANILSAVVKDLNSNTQVYGSALKTSIGATNEANTANARLNRTLSAMISQTGTELTRFGENVGKITLEPIAKAILGPLKGVVEGINNLLDGEGTGSEFANGFLKGIRNIIAGPGMIAAIAIIGTTFIKTLAYITQALPTIVGITTETQKRAKLEATITAMLQTDAGLAKQVAAAEGNAAKQAGLLLGAAQKTATAFKTQETSVTNMARMLATIGMTTNKMGAITPATGRGAFGRGAGGYIPGVSGELHDIHKGVGGVSSSARPVHIPNFAFGGGRHGGMIANTGEHVVPNFKGGGSAIFNPAMIAANGGLPQGAKKVRAAQGYVPNFALSVGAATKQIMAGSNPAGWNSLRLPANVTKKANANIAARTPKKGAAARGLGIDQTGLNLSASAIGLGAIVGTQTGKAVRTVSSPFSSMKTIAGKPRNTYARELQAIWGPKWETKTVELENIPVKAIPGKLSETKFRKKINTHLAPGLHGFAVDTFGSVFKGDQAATQFVEGLAKNQFVFSKQAEGGIFETALKLATGSSKSFGINEQASIDFNEASNMDSWLQKRFFKGTTVTRADAKRTDDYENIRSLVPKAMADALMGTAILNQYIRPAAKAAGAGIRVAPSAAGGYVPNFSGLGAAISREKKSGVPSSSIRINSAPRFQSPQNPAGLAVTNKLDEPGGLRDVPNFADPTIGFGSGRRGSVGGPAVMMLDETTKMLAVEQRKLIAATKLQIANAIGTGLTAKELIVAEKQLIAETRKSAAFKKMSVPSQQQYIAALRQETAQLNASVPGKGAGGMGGMMGGKGMMAGMGVMMAAPMLGGAIEQNVGGRGGAATSGALTGLGTGAGMGMMFGPWGAAIGGVVGLLGGLGVALYATRETFESLVEDAEEVGAALKGNQEAVEAYKKAITAQNEATAGTREHIEATKDARQALLAIGDSTLRSAIIKTKDNFEALNKEMEEHTTFEEEKRGGLELKALLIDTLSPGGKKDAGLSISGEKTILRERRTATKGGSFGTGTFDEVKIRSMTADDIADNALLLFGDVMKTAIEGGVKPENLKRALNLGIPQIVAPPGITGGAPQEVWAGRQRGGAVSAPARSATEDEIGTFISGLKLTGASADALAAFLKENVKAREVWVKGGMALYESQLKAAAELKDETDKKEKIANDLLKTRLEEMRAYKKRIIEMRKGNDSEKRRTKMNNALVSFQTSLFKKTGQSATSLAAMTSGGVAAAAQQRRGSLTSEFVIAQEKGIKTLIDGLELTAKTDRDFMRHEIFNKLTAGDVGGAITGIRGVQDLQNINTETKKMMKSVQKTADIEKLNDYANKLEEDFDKQRKNLELELKLLDLKDKQNVINAARIEREGDIARQMAVMAAVSKTGLDARANQLSASRTRESLFFQDPMNLVGMSNVQVAQRKKTGELGLLDEEQRLERDKQATKQGQEIVKALAGAEINRLTRDLIDKELQLIQALKDNTAAVRGEPKQGGGGVVAGGGGTPVAGGGGTSVAGAAARREVDKETFRRAAAGGGPVNADGWPISRADQKAAYIEERMSAQVRRGSPGMIKRARGFFGRDFEKQNPLGAGAVWLSTDEGPAGTRVAGGGGGGGGPDTRGVRGLNVGDYREATPVITGPRLGKSQMEKKSARLESYKQKVATWQKKFGLTAGGAVGAVPEGMAPLTSRGAREEAAKTMQDLLVMMDKLEKELKSGADEVVFAKGKGAAGKAATSPLAAATSKAEKTTLPEIDVSKLDKDALAILATLDPEKDKNTIDIIKQIIKLHKEENAQLDDKLKTNKENTEAIQAQAVALQKQRTGPGAFKRGVDMGTDKIAKETDEIFYVLGEELPMQFRNNMVGAIGAAMDKTSSLGDALDGVALAFLSTMRNAFLQSAVGNMMNLGKTLWTGSQRGGSIRAQNGRFVGGNSTGDRHPALLESGEYVLNRNAVGALGGPDALNSINFGMAPRFQKGGGHLMKLAEKIPSSRFSGLFLQNSNPEYDEYADAAVEKQQKAMEKHQKKEQKKAMILSTIISGVMAAGMGALSKGISNWGNKPGGVDVSGSGFSMGTGRSTIAEGPALGPQRGGYIGRQAGGSIGGAVARRYGLFQGGGTVPVASGAPSLGGSTNTNNISINIGLGGDNGSPGSGASQTDTGNTGAPSKATTADAKALTEKIKSQVLKILTEEQRVGGTLSPSARRP